MDKWGINDNSALLFGHYLLRKKTYNSLIPIVFLSGRKPFLIGTLRSDGPES